MRGGLFYRHNSDSLWMSIIFGLMMLFLSGLVYGDLTSVSVTMGNSKAGVSSIHTISFTTSLNIPSDGKIVCIYPASFSLNSVSGAWSSTINGSINVTTLGDSVVVTRNGDGSIETGGETETIHIAVITNAEIATNYSITVRTKNSDDSKIEYGYSSNFTIVHNSLDQFSISKAGGDETAGDPFGITITAQDQYGNTVTSYSGTANLSDLTGTIFQKVTTSFSSGSWSGNVTITQSYSGNSITATGNGKAGTSSAFNVIANNVNYFEIDAITSPQTAGVGFTIDVTGYDQWDNIAEGFNGTVNISELSGKVAISPAVSNNFSNGSLIGQNMTITEAEQDLKVRVDDGFGHSGTSGYFNVVAASVDHFIISSIATQNAGRPFLITVTAMDLYDNIATSFNGSGNQVNISLISAGTITPTTSDDFTNGFWTDNVSIIQTQSGEQIQVNDGSGHTGTSNAFDIVSSDVDHFIFNSIGSQSAGVGFSVTITAQDANNNTVTSFNGTVNLMDETGTVTPQQITFTAGSCTQTIAITESMLNNSLTVTGLGKSGNSNLFNVSPAAADHFEIDEVNSPQTAGTAFSILIRAIDAYGNVATSFGGTVSFSDVTGTISPSTSQNFSNGSRTESVTITRFENDVNITVNDGSGHTGTSNLFNVSHGPLSSFIIPVIADQATGKPFSVKVLALDNFNNLVTSFSGTGHTADITHTGSGPIVPTVTDEFLSGIWVGNVTIQQTQSSDRLQFTQTGGGASGISNNFQVTPSSVDHFVISTISGVDTAGVPFNVTVTAQDANNNIVTTFNGTANIFDETGTNSPEQINFVNGSWSGDITITKSYTNNTLTVTGVGKVGTSNLFNVIPAPLNTFEIGTIGSPQIAGQNFLITITARDEFGNIAADFNGTISLSDETGTLSPATSGVFTDGIRNQSVHIEKAQKDIHIIASYNGYTGQSNPFNVEPGGLDHFTIAPIGDRMAGVSFTIQITAEDQYDNVATSFTGKVDMEDLSGTLDPSTSTNFISGQWTRGVTIDSAMQNDQISVIRTGGFESGSSNYFHVSEPPGVRISSFYTSQNHVTAGQDEDWTLTMVVYNEVSSHAILEDIDFLFSSYNVPQNDYSLIIPVNFKNSGNDTLAGNTTDTLITTVDQTGLVTGPVRVEGRIRCIDTGTGLPMKHDQDLDIQVQDSARLVIKNILVSQNEVTRGQTQNWKVYMVITNSGGSDIFIDSSQSVTTINFSEGMDWQIDRPSALTAGGWILSGDKTDTLVYIIKESSTGSAGSYSIQGSVSGTETNTGRILTDQTSGARGTVITLENQASLDIIGVENLAPNAPYVNINQDFKINVTLENSGGDEVNEITLTLNSNGASDIVPVIKEVEQLTGGISHLADFSINAFSTPTGPTGEIFYAQVSGYADNTNLFIEKGGSNDTTWAIIQNPANLQVIGVITSEDTVREGQGDLWKVKVIVKNIGGATVVLNPPKSDNVSFIYDGIPFKNYSINAPTSLSIRGDLILPGGEVDTLIYEIRYTGGGGWNEATEVKATIEGLDKNDGTALIHSNSSTIIVIPDPNLRIIETKIRTVNMKGLEDGYVNTNQSFEVVAVIENGLGKTVNDIRVLLYTSGQSEILDNVEEIPVLTSTARIDSVIFPVRAYTEEVSGGETFFSTITQAKVDGADYPSGTSLDSSALVIIQLPAELSIQLESDPANGIVSKNKEFTLMASLENHGTAAIDNSGIIRLLLPNSDYQLISDNESEPIQIGDEVEWTIRSPNQARESEYITVKLETIPNDKNTGSQAIMDTDFARIQITTIDHGLNTTISIIQPNGAIDGIVSTRQDFELKAVLTWNNVDKISAVLDYPSNYQTAVDTQTVPDIYGNHASLIWQVRAPDQAMLSEPIMVRAWGVDSLNQSEVVTAVPSSVNIETVERADLSLDLEIVSPPDAIDGIVTLGQSFIIMAGMSNQGDASIVGVTEVELNPLPQGYWTIEKYKKELDFSGTASWSITAPNESTGETVNIGATIRTIPDDINTNEKAYVSKLSATVGITTQGAWLSASMIPVEENSTIVPGQTWVKLMSLEFDNRGEETSGSIFVDTLKFVLEDLDYVLLIPNSVLSQIIVTDDQNTTMVYGQMTPSSSSYSLVIGLDPSIEVTSSEKLRVAIYGSIAEETTVNYFRLNLVSSESIVARNASYQSIPVRDPTQEEWNNWRPPPKKIFQSESESILFNCPNPFGKNGEKETSITYYLDENSEIQFKIFTLLGELVWSKTIVSSDPLAVAGRPQTIPWDGTNDHGYDVINGVYILYLITNKKILARTKIGVIR